MKKYIITFLSIIHLSGCVRTNSERLMTDNFMSPENIYGNWEIVGFQNSWYISNAKDESFVNKSIGQIISMTQNSYTGLGRYKSYTEKLDTNYTNCDIDTHKEDCDNAMLRIMHIGKIQKIITFETCDPTQKTPYTNCLPAYNISLYIFRNGESKFMIHSDGGYFIIEKIENKPKTKDKK